MPTYEYSCRNCGHRFEIQQAMSDDPLTECPECAGELKKVFHPVGISFKGSGFYKNDARSDGGGSKGSSGASSTESGSNGSDSTSSSTSESSESSESSGTTSSGSSESKKVGAGSGAPKTAAGAGTGD